MCILLSDSAFAGLPPGWLVQMKECPLPAQIHRPSVLVAAYVEQQAER